jgi:hypothetical protein
VPLDDPERLADLSRRAMTTDEDYLLEAHAYYVPAEVRGRGLLLAPSAHIIDGRVAEGVTLQLVEGTVWRGNVFLDRSSCHLFGLREEQYDLIRRSMDDFIAGFATTSAGQDLIKGGIDFAVARVGGRFGDDTLVGMQDLNLSSHGAEYLRLFLDDARVLMRAETERGASIYAATQVVRPGAEVDLEMLRRMTDRQEPGRVHRTIAAVPGRWGLIAVAATDPVTALAEVTDLECRLRSAGMA